MARTVYEIPLSPEAQTFAITLAGKQYRLTLRWNAVAECWVLDIRDVSGAPVLLGIPVVTGLDLLMQYAFMGFGGMLVAQTDHDADAVPQAANLGTAGRLYFVVSS